jgi:hypothetical protein
VQGSALLASLTLLGAAPAPLAKAVTRVYTGPQGVTAAMRNGLVVYFGNATRPHAKWLSLARVLADPSSAGAVYVDVRVPGRPAAGFGGAGPPEAATTATTPTSAADPATAAELAAGLTSALGLSSGEQPAPLEESATGASSEATSGATAQAGAAAQAGPSTGGESASRTAPEAPATAPAGGG